MALTITVSAVELWLLRHMLHCAIPLRPAHEAAIYGAVYVLQLGRAVIPNFLPAPDALVTILAGLIDIVPLTVIYRGYRRRTVFVIGAYYVLLLAGELVALAVLALGPGVLFLAPEDLSTPPFLVLANLIRQVAAAALLAVVKRALHWAKTVPDTEIWLAVLPVVLVAFAQLMALVPTDEEINLTMAYGFALICCSAVALIVLALLVVAYRDDQRRRATESAALREMVRALSAQRHDAAFHRRQLQAMAARGDLEGLRAYLDAGEARGHTYTGNTIVDNLLSAAHAQADGIRFNVSGQLPEGIPWIAPQDLTVCIGNALQNAVDAVGRMDAPEREISADFTLTEGALLCRISNRFSSDYAPRRSAGTGFVSRKAKPGHGHGLSAIRRIARQYGGDMDVQMDEAAGRFTLTILLKHMKGGGAESSGQIEN